MNSKLSIMAKGHWQLFLLIILTAFSTPAQSQNNNLQLLNQLSEQPIIGATYQYGEQRGVSDANGMIDLHFIENEILKLSHVSYGKWRIAPSEVQQAFQTGKIFAKEKPITFQPVTIIALRPTMRDTEILELDNEERLAHDGGALLNKTPLISSIRKSGSYGFDPVMRGFKYEQLNIVINGAQSAIAACPNRMDPPTSQVAPNMTDRIEILKGPHSLRYGSAFGGTINFVSNEPTFSPDQEIYGRVTGHYEGNGDVVRSEGMIGFRGNIYDLGVFGSWSQGNDYTDGDGNNVPSQFLRGSFGAVLGLKVASNQHLSLSATRNLARDVDFPTLMMDLRSDDTWLLNAHHVVNFKKPNLNSWNTTVFTTLVSHVMDNLSKDLNPRMLNAVTDASTQTYGGRTEGTWIYTNSKLYAGVDLRMEQAQGTRTREFLMGMNAGKTVYDNVWQNGRINKTGAFGEYHLTDGSLNFVFSGRLELNNSSISDPASEFTDVNSETTNTQVNPSFSAGGVNHFDNGFNLGLWLGRAQRSGSLTERFINYFPVGMDPYEMIGNPNLKPEVNNQIDLTVGYEAAKTAIELTLFSSFLQDYITSEVRDDLTPRLPMSPGVRQFINIDKAYMTGAEITWNQILGAGLQHNLSMAYTYGQDKVHDEPLPEIAPLDFRYTLSGSYFKSRVRPEAAFRYVMQQERISASFGETTSPAFVVVDLKVDFRIYKPLRATIGVQNLFNEAYYEHLNRNMNGAPINAPGRNVFVSLSLDLM